MIAQVMQSHIKNIRLLIQFQLSVVYFRLNVKSSLFQKKCLSLRMEKLAIYYVN